MNHLLTMKLDRVDGALLRVLGVAERRGWTAAAMRAESCSVRDELSLALTVFGTRRVELLVRQLARLQDVRTVEVSS